MIKKSFIEDKNGEEMEKDILRECTLCPRNCKVNRYEKIGRCGMTANIKIALADLHFYEEPCISGLSGSGAIFFSGCNLNCVYCQNYEISQEKKGYEISIQELADKMIELQEKIVNIRQEIYDLMLVRNKEGLTSTADTVKANKALVQGQTDLIELKKNREKMLHQMCVLIGESPENANLIKRNSLDSINYQLAIPSQIPSEIIMQRPDYMKAELMVEKAGIDVKVARKEFLPSINILGGALFNANDIGSLFTTKNMLLGFGGGLMTPLFQGGSLIANLKLKKATYERILQDYYKTNLTAIQEVNDALVASRLDKDKMAQTTKQYNLEKSDYQYNEKKFNQGTISKLDLIQYQENLLTIEKLVAQQKVECMTDAISLYKATGSKPYEYVN